MRCRKHVACRCAEAAYALVLTYASLTLAKRSSAYWATDTATEPMRPALATQAA